jgi:ribosome biogenesis protein NSA1
MQFNVGGILSCGVFDTKGNVLAVGGKEKDLNIYGLSEGKNLFKAKNVPHNFLDMQVPVWIRDVCFLQPYLNGGAKLATCTSYAQVRLYDTKAMRKPTASIEGIFGEDVHPLTAIHASDDKNYIYVGDSVGGLTKVDLRVHRAVGKFKGIGGGIKSIQVHPSENIIATVGLDRALRVYNTETRALLDRLHLKQRLQCCLMSHGPILREEKGDLLDDEGVTAKEEEDMWYAETHCEQLCRLRMNIESDITLSLFFSLLFAQERIG